MRAWTTMHMTCISIAGEAIVKAMGREGPCVLASSISGWTMYGWRGGDVICHVARDRDRRLGVDEDIATVVEANNTRTTVAVSITWARLSVWVLHLHMHLCFFEKIRARLCACRVKMTRTGTPRM